jgi:hypothetical protein
MSTPSAPRSRSRSRSNDGAVGRLRPAASGGGSDISETIATIAHFNILNRVKSIQLEVEDLRNQFGSQLRQVASKISATEDDNEIIELGLIELQTRLRRQRRQLDKVLSMTDDLEKIGLELIVLCT